MRLLICAVAFLTASCADTYAAEGAKSGAVGGAVAGAVLGVFTGNIGGSMVAGAAASAAAGAAIGGMTPKTPQGAAATSAQVQGNPALNDPKLLERQQALEKKIGPANFDAARMLALCRHDSAIELARSAYGSADTHERRGYALMIEAVAAEEKGDSASAAAVYRVWWKSIPGSAARTRHVTRRCPGFSRSSRCARTTGARDLLVDRTSSPLLQPSRRAAKCGLFPPQKRTCA